MRAWLVVFAQPLFGNVLYLLDGLERVGIEHLVPINSVEALNVGALVWLEVPISMVSASRLASSMTFKVRKRRPS